MNTIIIDGRLVEDPTKQMLGKEGEKKAVCNFRIGHTSAKKNSQTGEYETFFIDVTAWRNQAEYLCSGTIQKGDLILIQGSYEVREWVDRYSGKKRSRGQINANSIQLMRKKQDTKPQSNGYAEQIEEAPYPEVPPVWEETAPPPPTQAYHEPSTFEDDDEPVF